MLFSDSGLNNGGWRSMNVSQLILLVHYCYIFDRFFIIKHEAIAEKEKNEEEPLGLLWPSLELSCEPFFLVFLFVFEEKRREKRLRKNNQSITVRKKSYWEAAENKEAAYESNYWRQFVVCLFHTQTLQTIALALCFS